MTPVQLKRVVSNIVQEAALEADRGLPASYIPELTVADVRQFGIVISTSDGAIIAEGDADVKFSIQSVSKLFALTLALGKVGDQLWERVGREPSGSAFNSIVQLEHERGIPRNPFINAGALVLADINLAGHRPREAIGEYLRFLHYLTGDSSVVVDERVACSEAKTAFRNLALANYMRDFGNLHHAVDLVLGTYTHQCATSLNCRQLASAGRYLMLGGRHPDGGRVVSEGRARRILALMLTCGLYDASGDFAYRVGVPSKSGVSGAILGIVPGVASIAVWSPGIDNFGNSKIGVKALEKLADATGWSVFASRG